MGRYRIHLAVLAILMAVSAYLILGKRSGTYSRSSVEFAVEDTSQISAVEISGKGESVLLLKEGPLWRVNGRTPVRMDRMQGFLILISRLEVKSPASRTVSAEIRKQLQTNGKRVMITGKKGPEKVYTVFHGDRDVTYMMLEDSDTPFRMGVRGYSRQNLEALYSTDERYWRDNLVFHYLPDQIRQVSMINNLVPETTFHLARNEKGSFDMSVGVLPAGWFPPDEAKLRQYLGYFYHVRFDSYADLSQEAGKNYFHDDEPDFILEVESTKGIWTDLKLFPVYTIDTGGNKKMDLNMLVARIDDWDEMVVMKYIEIDPLLKDPQYFQSE
jgi:hypothetical protein